MSPCVGFECPSTARKTFKECIRCTSPSCPSKIERLAFIKKQKMEDAKTCGDFTRCRASQISFLCEGMDVMQRQVDYYLPMNLMEIFRIGEATHKEIQSVYPKECCEVQVTRQYNGFKVTGSIDILYKRNLEDIKTCSNFYNLPKYYHNNQLSIYGIYADGLFDSICLRAVNKSTGATKRWYLKKPTITEEQVISYVKNVTDYLAHKPVRLRFNFDACGICNVKSFCKQFREVLEERGLLEK